MENTMDIEVGRIVYLVLGLGGIMVGMVGVGVCERKYNYVITYSFVIIGGIVSLILFASTFGRLVW